MASCNYLGATIMTKSSKIKHFNQFIPQKFTKTKLCRIQKFNQVTRNQCTNLHVHIETFAKKIDSKNRLKKTYHGLLSMF